MTETELKFQVPPERRVALQRAVATTTATTTRLQAVYADTADRRLAAAGLALRLRQEGRHWVQTLKGRGDGLMQRLEHELPLPAQAGIPTLDARRHAGTPVGSRLLALLADGTALQPIYRTDIRRLHRVVRHGGALIELAYDRGHILAGTQKARVDEIEFELVRGPRAALLSLAARWAQQHGLWWDVRTKSERGYRLALGLHTVPAVPPARLRLPAAGATMQDFGPRLQQVLAQCLPNAAEIASGSGAEAHHLALRQGLAQLGRVLRAAAPGAADAAEVLALAAAWQALAAEALPARRAGSGATDAGAAVRGPLFNRLMLQTLALA